MFTELCLPMVSLPIGLLNVYEATNHPLHFAALLPLQMMLALNILFQRHGIPGLLQLAAPVLRASGPAVKFIFLQSRVLLPLLAACGNGGDEY